LSITATFALVVQRHAGVQFARTVRLSADEIDATAKEARAIPALNIERGTQ
jgi:hypothetical protein